jgi:hypothetical protein
VCVLFSDTKSYRLLFKHEALPTICRWPYSLFFNRCKEVKELQSDAQEDDDNEGKQKPKPKVPPLLRVVSLFSRRIDTRWVDLEDTTNKNTRASNGYLSLSGSHEVWIQRCKELHDKEGGILPAREMQELQPKPGLCTAALTYCTYTTGQTNLFKTLKLPVLGTGLLPIFYHQKPRQLLASASFSHIIRIIFRGSFV